MIITEETETGYSSFSPDVPGCIATGATQQESEKNMLEALEFHLEGMKIEDYDIPQPHSHATYLEPVI